MNEEMIDFVESLQTWHANKVSNLRDVQAGSKEGTLLKLGEESEGMPMTAEAARFFRLGIEVCLMELGKLPFTLNPVSDEDDEG